jgi:hypothetical protein
MTNEEFEELSIVKWENPPVSRTRHELAFKGVDLAGGPLETLSVNRLACGYRRLYKILVLLA